MGQQREYILLPEQAILLQATLFIMKVGSLYILSPPEPRSAITTALSSTLPLIVTLSQATLSIAQDPPQRSMSSQVRVIISVSTIFLAHTLTRSPIKVPQLSNSNLIITSPPAQLLAKPWQSLTKPVTRLSLLRAQVESPSLRSQTTAQSRLAWGPVPCTVTPESSQM